jgi:cephalosporin-C deacetylase-like acetyl esterase
VEDHERAVVAGIRQGAGVALAAMQLRVRLDLHWVAPGFPEFVEQEKRVELVNDFAAASAAVVAAMNVEDILHGGG